MPKIPFVPTDTSEAAERFADTTVLVTGASSGIGEALAREAAVVADTVVLVARRRDRLEEVARRLAIVDRHGREPLRVEVIPADLSTPEGVRALVDDVSAAGLGVDVLVNNAGFGDYALLEEAEPDTLARMIAVNVTAPTLLTRALLPAMIEHGRGAILMVGSSAGRMPTPGAAVYAATKHYVDGLSEGLRGELAGTGVTLTQLQPGPVATEFDDVSGMGPLTNAVGVARISAEQCAREAWEGLSQGRAVVFPGAVLRTMMRASSLTPRVALRPALAAVGRRSRQESRGRVAPAQPWQSS
ncbi:SDR family NAD(P)-dependent oxidoreductase [Mobilicoccus pelagius]|uniref:Putative oxidoreductase n=1 Tax=Mobilicoccus pelagius NBRC 104925 TaxID=1089455 RepID=H5UU97_9MICO|nr:SDR family oxidoreductase [Mobilicoccus pelagius]GAB49305.1 putative oxidoreductase [Mobilicoccus pelagius NBRC 104925]